MYTHGRGTLCWSWSSLFYILGRVRYLIIWFSATLVATIGSFGLGTVLSWSAPTLPQLTLNSEFSNLNATAPSFVLTKDEQSWVASLLNFGAFTAGPLSGKTGWKIFSDEGNYTIIWWENIWRSSPNLSFGIWTFKMSFCFF